MLASGHSSLLILENLIDWKATNVTPILWFLYFPLVLIFILQIYFLTKSKINTSSWLKVGLIVSFLMMLSYPIMSRDLFSYLFAAKIVVNYNANPYFFPPDIFSKTDLWFGFTHWVDRVYVYPIFSLIYTSFIMFIIGSSRFILNFFAFKLVHWLFFTIAGLYLYKHTDKKLTLSLWFFNPILLMELLVNSHNDVVMISLFIIAYIYTSQRKIISICLYIISVLTKTVSLIFLPVWFLPQKFVSIFLKITTLLLLLFLLTTSIAIQPWYTCWIFMALPFAKFNQKSLLLFFIYCFISILDYLPFLLTNHWQPLLPNNFVHNIRLLLLILIIGSELIPRLPSIKKLISICYTK